ncbi:F0F1 ATP synthase subunit epsilon [Candidatus Dependentiae bacterium]
MELKIVSPEGSKTHEIIWLELNTSAGNFVIQPEHAPMIVTLAPDKDVIFCLKNGKQETFAPTGGIAEITRHSATLLINQMPK